MKSGLWAQGMMVRRVSGLPDSWLRHRGYCLAGVGLAILAGLASRRYPELLPAAWGKYPGDALWVLMVFYWLAALRPAMTAPWLAACAFGIAAGVEFSQLYHSPWLDSVRHTTVGHLVLGSGFAWRDFIAYAMGALVGLVLDSVVRIIHQTSEQGRRDQRS